MSFARVLPASLAVLLLAACSSDGGSPGSSVAVKAGDKSCDVAKTELEAGSTTFAVKNVGSQTTEVYVYGEDDGKYTKVVSEVENIGPGLSRDMTVDLGGGKYEIACKPGQKGDGIRTAITVSGEKDDAEAAYDREVELKTDGGSLTGLPDDASAGEKIEFKVENTSSGPLTFEVKDPSGTVVGEVEDIAAGAEKELVVELKDSGAWKLVIEGAAGGDISETLTVA